VCACLQMTALEALDFSGSAGMGGARHARQLSLPPRLRRLSMRHCDLQSVPRELWQCQALEGASKLAATIEKSSIGRWLC
jgi:hypothetical protein